MKGDYPVYIRFKDGKSAKTEEIVDGKVFADYDTHWRLLGVELLGPVAPISLSLLLISAEYERRPKMTPS